ncbi:helix-turn-helix domain-containing protein [Lysobacter sp. MMG2]|nr:helix-turn-helix domain-containing protein [Lysobacter sp. MMG2]
MIAQGRFATSNRKYFSTVEVAMLRISSSEFEEFVAAVPAISGRYLQTGRSVRAWRLSMTTLGDVTIVWVRGGARNIFHGTSLAGRYSLYLPISEPTVVALNGLKLANARFGSICPGQEFILRTDAPTLWAGFQVPCSAVRHRVGFDHDDATLLAQTRVLQATPLAIARLFALTQRLRAVEARDPDVLDGTPSRNALAQQLLDAIFEMLHRGDPRDAPKVGRRPMQRHRIMERCLELIESRLDCAPTVEDLCSVAGVSDRTLRTVFIEQCGVAPHRYLMIRRLHAIHEALCYAVAGETVTSICSAFGVWDFGRLARQYHSLYGALPSQHLHRAGRMRRGKSHGAPRLGRVH